MRARGRHCVWVWFVRSWRGVRSNERTNERTNERIPKSNFRISEFPNFRISDFLISEFLHCKIKNHFYKIHFHSMLVCSTEIHRTITAIVHRTTAHSADPSKSPKHFTNSPNLQTSETPKLQRHRKHQKIRKHRKRKIHKIEMNNEKWTMNDEQ